VKKSRGHSPCVLRIIHPFIVDFYRHSLRLVVEIDGGVHEAQHGVDDERDRFLTTLGLQVLRFPNRRVLADIKGVMAEVELVCRERLALTPPQNGEG
jgi:very-short-patch-repair endonuclease